MMPEQAYAIKGRTALVTGAGSGLGEATALAFAREGCSVACIDLNRSAVERVSANVERPGMRTLAFVCDVSDAAAVAAAVQEVINQFGQLDIIVNCAAIDHTLSVEEMSIEQWDQVIGVNLRGPFLLAKTAWPFFKRQKSGHIINIASTAALRSWANASAYHASKRGLMGLGQGLSVEGRPYGIRVTTIIPGGMNTHFFDRFAQQEIPMPDPQHLQDPAIVAETILHVASIPPTSVIQEVLLTPLTETSWP